jgi:hypothetical protein
MAALVHARTPPVTLQSKMFRAALTGRGFAPFNESSCAAALIEVLLSQFHSPPGVHVEESRSRASDRRQGDDFTAAERKVHLPNVLPGIEEGHHVAVLGIDARQIGPFVGVASVDARQS